MHQRRRHATDAEFRYRYTERAAIDWGKRELATFGTADWKPLDDWDAMRRDFTRFYLLRASAKATRVERHVCGSVKDDRLR